MYLLIKGMLQDMIWRQNRTQWTLPPVYRKFIHIRNRDFVWVDAADIGVYESENSLVIHNTVAATFHDNPGHKSRLNKFIAPRGIILVSTNHTLPGQLQIAAGRGVSGRCAAGRWGSAALVRSALPGSGCTRDQRLIPTLRSKGEELTVRSSWHEPLICPVRG